MSKIGLNSSGGQLKQNCLRLRSFYIDEQNLHFLIVKQNRYIKKYYISGLDVSPNEQVNYVTPRKIKKKI